MTDEEFKRATSLFLDWRDAKRSPWLSGNVAPVRSGWYEIQFNRKTTDMSELIPAYWTWGYGALTGLPPRNLNECKGYFTVRIATAWGATDIYLRLSRLDRWRGLALDQRGLNAR